MPQPQLGIQFTRSSDESIGVQGAAAYLKEWERRAEVAIAHPMQASEHFVQFGCDQLEVFGGDGFKGHP